MSKYWFGSLEQITDQHDDKGHLKPTATKAVKGWKVVAREDYPDPTKEAMAYREAIRKDRDALAETWWAESEIWWAGQQHNLDLKGKVDDTRVLDYQPIRETGDFQLRITGPVDVPEPPKPKEEIKKTTKP